MKLAWECSECGKKGSVRLYPRGTSVAILTDVRYSHREANLACSGERLRAVIDSECERACRSVRDDYELQKDRQRQRRIGDRESSSQSPLGKASEGEIQQDKGQEVSSLHHDVTSELRFDANVVHKIQPTSSGSATKQKANSRPNLRQLEELDAGIRLTVSDAEPSVSSLELARDFYRDNPKLPAPKKPE